MRITAHTRITVGRCRQHHPIRISARMRRYGVHFRHAGRYQIFNKRRRSVGDVAVVEGRIVEGSISSVCLKLLESARAPPSPSPLSSFPMEFISLFDFSSFAMLSCFHGHLPRCDCTSGFSKAKNEPRWFSLLINDREYSHRWVIMSKCSRCFDYGHFECSVHKI